MYLEDYFTATPVKHLISMVLCQGKISVWLSYIGVDQLPAFSKENIALQHPSSVTCKQLEQTGPKAMVFYQVRLLLSMGGVASWCRSSFWSSRSWIHFGVCGFADVVKLLYYPEEWLWNNLGWVFRFVCLTHPSWLLQTLSYELLIAFLVKQGELQNNGLSAWALHNLSFFWSIPGLG